MVSKKLSSKKSSSRKSLSKTDTENIENMIKMNPISQSTIILAGILGIIYNLDMTDCVWHILYPMHNPNLQI